MGRKSRAAIALERHQVLAVVRDHPEGIAYDAIQAAYARTTGATVAYTTLRNRLDELEYEKLVERIDTRRRKPLYRPVRQPAATPGSELPGKAAATDKQGHEAIGAAVTADSPPIPLSSEAIEIRRLVRRPRTARPPAAYDSSFLDRYTPGESWYLPRDTRERLTTLGTTTFAGQAAGTYARDIMERLVIDLSWGSSRLEGNRYSRIDTEELLQHGRDAEGASDHDRQMILNHKAAIEFLVENAQEIGFNRYTILGLHALLSENLLPNPDDEGRLRTRPVGIGTSVYTPTEIPQVIEERFNRVLEKAARIPDPIEQAFLTMVHLPYLQPFMDVNKRTSRLAANIPLIKSNMCPLSFVDVPESLYTEGTLAVYEQTRMELLRDVFQWAYERSCQQFGVLRQAMGDPDPIRLRYRSELRALVAESVRGLKLPDDAGLFDWAVSHGVAETDHRAFAHAARTALSGLRADILARYGLRLSEFTAWEAAVRGVRPPEPGDRKR